MQDLKKDDGLDVPINKIKSLYAKGINALAFMASNKCKNFRKSDDMYIIDYINIVWSPLFKGGSITSPWGIWKIKKRGGSLVQRQVFLKGGEGVWHFSYLIFSRFIIFTFRNYFTLYRIVLCIWRKIIFFCHHNFMKKGHSKLSKNEPENVP